MSSNFDKIEAPLAVAADIQARGPIMGARQGIVILGDQSLLATVSGDREAIKTQTLGIGSPFVLAAPCRPAL